MAAGVLTPWWDLRQTVTAFLQFFTSCVPLIFHPGEFGTANELSRRRFRRSNKLGPLSVYAVFPSIEIKQYTTCKNLQKATLRLPPGVANAGDKMVPG